VEAGFRLVQHEKTRRARRQKRGDPEQIPKRAVGQLGGLERPEQAVLLHLDLEPSALPLNRDPGPGKCVGDGLLQRRPLADLADGLERGGKVAAVVAENRRVGPDLRQPRRRGGIRPEVIVEAPDPHFLTQHQHLRRGPRIGAVRHHAVEAGKLSGQYRPLPALLTRLDERPATVHEHARWPQRRAAPDTFPLDLGVVAKHARRGGETEIDRIAEIVAAEPEAQADGIAAGRALHRLLTAAHRPREVLRARP
jgi:hypothetical protein